MTDQLLEVRLDEIVWPEETDITTEQIANMAKSLEANEQIEPIVVTKRMEDAIYRGVIGRLRYEGTKTRWKGDLSKTILARVHAFESEADIVKWQLAENEHRRQIPAMMKAKLYQKLAGLLETETGGKETVTLKMLSDAVEEATGDKESTKTVQHYLSLNKLDPKVQEVLTREKAPLRTGLELLRLKSPESQVKVAKEIASGRLIGTISIQDVKWKVDSALSAEGHDRHLERLKKKAEELRKEGKVVFSETASYNESRSYERLYDGIPKDCEECKKLGIYLSGNFRQEPICLDKECYAAKRKDRNKQENREQKVREKKAQEERAKVYDAPFDDRSWRLIAVGVVGEYDLERELNFGLGAEEKMWEAVQKLDGPALQKLLLKLAVRKVLTGPMHHDSVVKLWAVDEFKLQRDLFVKEEKTE